MDLICEVTQIDALALFGFHRLSSYAADVLRWAAKRQCSRPEDQAYALMGLLNINMPLLYGEGSRAFQRLQQEVLNTNDDESVLVWKLPPLAPASDRYALFAPSILCFADVVRNESGETALTDSNNEGGNACPWCTHTFLDHQDLQAHFETCVVMGRVTGQRPLMLSSRGLHAHRPIIRSSKFEASDQAFFVPLEVPQNWRTGNRFLLRVRPMKIGNVIPREPLGQWPKALVLNFAICCHDRLYTTQELEHYKLAPVANAEAEILILRDLPMSRF
jgi:hypothetical protein